MGIFDITYSIQFTRLLPSRKRSVSLIAWGASLVAPLQWLRDKLLNKYSDGYSPSEYNNVTPYTFGDEIQYRNRAYLCIKDTTGNVPTNQEFWLLFLENKSGAIERAQWNGQLLTLEYILNTWFNLTFIQPVFSPPSAPSSIFIDNNTAQSAVFYVGATSDVSSLVYETSNFATDFVYATSFTPSQINFTVNYPIADIPNPSEKYNELVSLVEKYKIYGSTPFYQSY